MTHPWTMAAWIADLAELPRAAAHGFTHVALEARIDRRMADLEALADAGVIVVAVQLRGDLALPDVTARREQLRELQRQVDDAALLGATLAWLTPGTVEQEVYLREGVAMLADYAARRQVRLAVEGIDHLALVRAPRLTSALQTELAALGFRGVVVVDS